MTKKSALKPRIRIPRNIKKGDVFEVKTLITHAMESGQRVDKKTKKKFPREIVNRLVVTYGGRQVLKAIWHPAVSANPYTSFFVRAGESGPMEFAWTDDNGVTVTKTAQVDVKG